MCVLCILFRKIKCYNTKKGGTTMSNIITKEEYLELGKDEHYSPGWQAIDDAFSEIYGKQEPKHYGTIITSRAIFGGDEYLYGYSIYESSKGYYHIVTYGMSNLYFDEKHYGQDYSGWGYEMTMKLKADSAEDCVWALNMLGNLARYTYTKKAYFQENEYILGDGSPIKQGSDSKICSLATTLDTEIEGRDTVHGRLDFIQIVGITWDDACKVHENKKKEFVKSTIDIIRKDNPDFVIDMDSTTSYL